MRKINYKPGNIQTTIMIAFSIISALIILSMGIMMYWRFSDISEEYIIENNQDYGTDCRECRELPDKHAADI